MSTSRMLKWITGGMEAILGFPLIGGTIIIGTYYSPLVIMLILHIVTLVLTNQDKGSSRGSVLGIITSSIGWIPFVGMIMHILSAVFLMVDASTEDGANK